MTLRLNLAALTEAELLSLFGPAGVQARFPEISRARLQGLPVLSGEVPAALLMQEVAPAEASGATPQQSLSLKQIHAALQGAAAEPQGTFQFPPEAERTFARAYLLGDTAVSVRWLESPGSAREDGPAVLLLTWLRDRASGVAGVLSSSAARPPAPAYSEEIDVHLHPEADVPELLRLHRQHVTRHGRAQKLAPEDGWRRIWQALYDLNLRSWQRRGAVVAAPD